MTPTDLRRLHAVTDNFFFWQGLRWIPLGAALVICSAVWLPALPLSDAVRPWVGLPVLLVALWLSTSVLGAITPGTLAASRWMRRAMRYGAR